MMITWLTQRSKNVEKNYTSSLYRTNKKTFSVMKRFFLHVIARHLFRISDNYQNTKQSHSRPDGDCFVFSNIFKLQN